MTAQFQIARATSAHTARFVDERLALFREMEALERGVAHDELARLTRRAFEALVARDSTVVWMAFDSSGDDIGSVALHVLERLPSLSNPVPVEGYISHVFVRADWRRRGVGSALLGVLVDEAQRRGLRRLRLHATAPGRALYETLGFRLRSNDMELRLEGPASVD